jgi:hypothetical protein
MERTKAYRSLLKGGVTLCVFVVIFFLCMLFSNNFWPLLISIGLLGTPLLHFALFSSNISVRRSVSGVTCAEYTRNAARTVKSLPPSI